VISIATSTGPKKADYTKCELKDGVPSGSEYSSTPKVAAQPKKLTLPTGKSDGAMPQEKLNG
jgi:hypothetical protein